MTNKELSEYRKIKYAIKAERKNTWSNKDADELEKRYALFNMRMSEIENYINNIDDAVVKRLCRLRYIKGYSWAKVAAVFGGGNTASSVRMMCLRYLNKRD